MLAGLPHLLTTLPGCSVPDSRLGPLTSVFFRWLQARLSDIGNSKVEAPSSYAILGCVKLQ